MKYFIFPVFVFILASCNHTEDTPEPSFTLVSSTCNMPETTVEVGSTFIVIIQNTTRFYAITGTNDLTKDFELTLKEKSYGFHSADPVWETTYMAKPSDDTLILQSSNCLNTFYKN